MSITPTAGDRTVWDATPATAGTTARRPSAFGRALVQQAALLAVIAALAAPAATPAAGAARWAFPALSMLAAGWLALRGRTGAYLGFCLWLFLLTPFVRRVADAHAGFAQANVLMLAPYLASAWGVLELPRFLLMRGGTAQWPMTALFSAIAYGFVLALAQGRLFPAVLDLLRWSLPPILACYIMARAASKPQVWEEASLHLRVLALIALPLISLYGLYQFAFAPLWDVLWMLNADMSSIGLPHPFQIRVFGTMNSPASLAYYLGALILITLALRSPLRWISVALGLAALAVTLVRSAWLALAVGMLLLLVRAPSRVRTSVMLLMAAAVTLSPLALSNPRVEKLVAERVQTLFNLGGDKSYSERSGSYASAMRELAERPWGEGIGIANVAANYTNHQRVIDGGPIEIMLSFGVIQGSVYLGAVGVMLIMAILRPLSGRNGETISPFATIAVVQTLALSSVTTVAGEIGVLFWVSIGLILASPRPSSAYLASRRAPKLV
jgi:hypothetical protein